MAEKKYIFGVRARLALIITLLLAGVSGTQYVINYRQQREVVSTLVELNRQINETILHIDRQLKASSQPSRVVQPAPGQRMSLERNSMARELQNFIDFLQANIGSALVQQSSFREMLERISALQKAALSLESSSQGSSFFRVTVSVMDEMSRKSPLWRYTISSQPLAPPAENILQVSIPIVEEGQVRFVHMQYEISDFLENFRRSRLTSLVVTLITLGIGLIFTLLYTGHFTRPIRALSDGFSRIERGELDCRIATRRKDELGQLVAGFNHMAQRLKQNKELEKTLYRQERLSSLGKLAAGIAHEIKNPLNAINLSLQHLGDKLAVSSPAERELFDRYSKNIQREVERLGRIVDTFLNFSRVSELERSPVNIHGLIEEVLSLLARDAESKGIRVETAFEKGELVKNVDPEKMKTVFLNLIINAIEAMPSGGRLRITTSGGGDKPAKITISDTGCGIAAENLERIFDLYYSTRQQGSGLGLSIVNNIIRDHGGEITVQSSLGTGSDFTLTIP
ncbi:MAG: HAMP domain-containing protein [Deltaproteobacteria bacterium]|nr:HAMP domain-containing protein [Deltaproteobacteria bacterium]